MRIAISAIRSIVRRPIFRGPGDKALTRTARWAAVIGLCAGLLQACAAPGYRGVAPVATPNPSYRDYLAARYAGLTRDTTAAVDYFLKALEGDPDNKALLRRAFVLSVQDSRFDQAIVLAKRLVEESSSGTIANLLLVLDDLRNRKYADARSKLVASPAVGINALFGPVIQAWSLAGEGQTDLAVIALVPLGAERSFRAFREYHQALILDAAGRDANAEAAYQSALGDVRGSIRLVLAYGRFLERRGRADDAAALYHEYRLQFTDSPLLAEAIDRAAGGGMPQAFVLDPAHGVAEALFGTAQALARENARSAATIYLRLALFLHPEMFDARLLLGGLLEGAGLYQGALREFAKIGTASPLSWGARLEMAILTDRLERTEEAIATLRAMIVERPNDFQAITTLADLLRDHERFGEAAALYSRVMPPLAEVKGNQWALYYSRGITLERTKRWEEAEADFLKALELQPDQPLVLNYLGYSWIEMGRNIDRAKKMIERAVELRPNDGFIVDSLGWANFHLGDFSGAIEMLERAVLLRPEDPTINDHLGDAYWKVGRFREARFQWSHALDLSPEDDLIAGIRAKLENGPTTAQAERP